MVTVLMDLFLTTQHVSRTDQQTKNSYLSPRLQAVWLYLPILLLSPLVLPPSFSPFRRLDQSCSLPQQLESALPVHSQTYDPQCPDSLPPLLQLLQFPSSLSEAPVPDSFPALASQACQKL